MGRGVSNRSLFSLDFLKGREAQRQRRPTVHPRSLGALLKLDESVEFVDRDGNKYEIVSTNDTGALLIGPVEALAREDMLKLGRRMNAGVVFLLCSVVSVELRGKTKLGNLRVMWQAFAGTSEDLVNLFRLKKMRVNMGDRFHRG